MSSGARPWVFGEVLFDRFPDGSQVLGGAPFNVAWHLQAFGHRPLLISRVGEDDDGARIRAAMDEWQMDGSALQADPELPTGGVTVRFNEGEPAYEIEHPVAYDAIEPFATDESPSLLYHGTLALRDAPAREALNGILAHNPETVFVDVNLRAPWWSREQVLERLRRADWVKLNNAELRELGGGGPQPNAARFLDEHQLRGLVLTHGARGAELYLDGGRVYRAQPRRGGPVVDAVGAGDALAAVIICGLLRGWDPQSALERAQEFASRVCGQRGATVRDAGLYASLLRRWEGPGS